MHVLYTDMFQNVSNKTEHALHFSKQVLFSMYYCIDINLNIIIHKLLWSGRKNCQLGTTNVILTQ